jgi:hypothetical protein
MGWVAGYRMALDHLAQAASMNGRAIEVQFEHGEKKYSIREAKEK